MEEDELSIAVKEDLNKLHTAWKIYLKNRFDGREDGVHLPPALIAACGGIFDDMTEELSLFTTDATLRIIATFGATMFAFGQNAITNGVLAANMDPCKCGEITDDDITNLLNGHK